MSELLRFRNDMLSLSPAQVRELFNFLGEILALHFMPGDIHTEFKEHRFKGGQVCIHCGSLCVVKSGKLGISVRTVRNTSTTFLGLH